jgi:hypothetical protein
VTIIYSRIADGIRMAVSIVFKATSCPARAQPCPACLPVIFISPGDRVEKNTLEYPPQDLSHNPIGNRSLLKLVKTVWQT